MTRALVILCGGLSTRMGSNKAFLPFGSGSLLNYQIERFRPYFETICLSVPAYDEMPFPWEEYTGCSAIPDLYPRIGPMGGLYSCMTAASEDILFFTPVDAPFTDPGLATQLCRLLEQDETAHVCTVKSPEGRLQPLFAAYSRKCLPELTALIRERTYKLQFLLTPETTLVPDLYLPTEQFFNMNDPQTYYYALQRLAGERPGEFPAGFCPANSRENADIPVLSFTARSGTGKTTYLEKLIPLLKQEHLRLAVVKHDAHGFTIDQPGKDSFRLTEAGADHMILTSGDRTAAILSHSKMNPSLETILSHIEGVDLILTEGYKLGNQKKIQLLRRGFSMTPVGSPENTIAYVTDFPFESELPVFDLNRPEELVPFLLSILHK